MTDKTREALENIRSLVEETWGFASTSPRGKENLTEVLNLLDLLCASPAENEVEPLKGWKLNHIQFVRGSGTAEIGYLDAEDDRFSPVVTVDTGLKRSAAPAVNGEAEYLRTVAELNELARGGPHVTNDWVLTVASMDPAEMRRRLIRSSDWHGHFAHSLDGIHEIQNLPGAGIDGCRSHKEVRAVVLGLVKKLAAHPTGEVEKDAARYRWLPHVGADEQGNATLEWWCGDRKITMYPMDGMLLKVWGPDCNSDMSEVRLEDADSVRAAFAWLTAAPKQEQTK